MKIAILVEGKTELAFKSHLLNFLNTRLTGAMPKLDFMAYDGRIPSEVRLKSVVRNYLLKDKYDAVIALTDVYTGTNDFKSAADAKQKMLEWVGSIPHFYPHVANHDFEAWLLPYWSDIQKLAGHNKGVPGKHPEQVNLNKPPSYHIKEIFLSGKKKRRYKKPRDAHRILKDKDLVISAKACPELKAFLNRILQLCDGELIP
ncbi:MAG: DUF4276 family protein [Candidatus Parabeggiatoa sp.]|nr:DUF4276 family protein [Candidatus Parabeggiatoa sp.]